MNRRRSGIVTVAGLLAIGVLLPGAAAPALAASDGPRVLTKSTELTEDVDGGFVIAADGITFDGHGHTVRDNGTTCHGVQLKGHSHVTIRNVRVEGFHCGAGFLVENLNAKPATHNLLVGNFASGNAVGFAVGGASHNEFVANQAVDNDGNNFQISGGSNANTFRDNFAFGGQFGFILAESSGNVFRGNTARAPRDNGFHTDRCPGTAFVENRAIETGIGFLVHNSPNSRLVGNVSSRSRDAAIGVMNGSDNTIVEGNRAMGYAVHGIVVTASTGVVVRDNAASGGFIGILVVGQSSRAAVAGNRIWGTHEAAIAVSENSIDARVTGNRSCATQGVDYREDVSEGVVLRGNRFCSMSRNGLAMPATDAAPVVVAWPAEPAAVPMLWARRAAR